MKCLLIKLKAKLLAGAVWPLILEKEGISVKCISMLLKHNGPFEIVSFAENRPPVYHTYLANRLYLTLPLDSIGSPAKAVEILVLTGSWGGGGGILLPNDDLPNSGLVLLSTIPVPPTDLRSAGNLDGSVLY
jgi:hypothetical protein